MVHYFAEDPKYFILLEADKKRLGWAKILMKVKLENISIIVDNKNKT
jgi:hypothetical protein